MFSSYACYFFVVFVAASIEIEAMLIWHYRVDEPLLSRSRRGALLDHM